MHSDGGTQGPKDSYLKSWFLLGAYVYFYSATSLLHNKYANQQKEQVDDGCHELLTLCRHDEACREIVLKALGLPATTTSSTTTGTTSTSTTPTRTETTSTSTNTRSTSTATTTRTTTTTSSTTTTTTVIGGEVNALADVSQASFVDVQRRLGEGGLNGDEDDDEAYELAKTVEVRECSWYVYRHPGVLGSGKPGEWEQHPHLFSQGSVVIGQSICGMIVFYTYNYYVGRKERLKLCFKASQLFKFVPVGLLYGLVTIFYANGVYTLSEGSQEMYYATGSVLALPMLWRIVFQTQISPVVWVTILLIAMGVCMFRIAELGSRDKFGGVGLFWSTLSVLGSALATLWMEVFLKAGVSRSAEGIFSIQICYIIPWQVLAACCTILILPPHGLPDRPGWLFHDWSYVTVFIMLHTLGDIVMGALIVKHFDALVKTVCKAMALVVPIWIVRCEVGWTHVEIKRRADQLQVSGSALILVAGIAFVLARQEWAEVIAYRHTIVRHVTLKREATDKLSSPR